MLYKQYHLLVRQYSFYWHFTAPASVKKFATHFENSDLLNAVACTTYQELPYMSNQHVARKYYILENMSCILLEVVLFYTLVYLRQGSFAVGRCSFFAENEKCCLHDYISWCNNFNDLQFFKNQGLLLPFLRVGREDI